MAALYWPLFDGLSVEMWRTKLRSKVEESSSTGGLLERGGIGDPGLFFDALAWKTLFSSLHQITTLGNLTLLTCLVSLLTFVYVRNYRRLGISGLRPTGNLVLDVPHCELGLFPTLTPLPGCLSSSRTCRGHRQPSIPFDTFSILGREVLRISTTWS